MWIAWWIARWLDTVLYRLRNPISLPTPLTNSPMIMDETRHALISYLR